MKTCDRCKKECKEFELIAINPEYIPRPGYEICIECLDKANKIIGGIHTEHLRIVKELNVAAMAEFFEDPPVVKEGWFTRLLNALRS